MTLVYLAIAWIGGIWLAHQLWSLGVIGCGTPGWLFWAGGRGRGGGRRAAAATSAGQAGRRDGRPVHLGRSSLSGAAARPLFHAGRSRVLQRHGRASGARDRRRRDRRLPDPQEARVSYRLRAERLTIGAQTRPVQGEVLVQTARYPEYVYGDRIRAAGQLETPPTYDDFDYAAYLSVRGIDSLLRRGRIELIAHDQGSPFWAALYGLRSRCSALLNRVLPEPAASLANGMLLGIEGGIPPEVDEAFKATGTTHVIVISGSNIALLTGVLMALLGLLIGKRRAAWPTAIAVVLYVLLVGADPSALRAGVMGVLFVFAIVLGRASTAYVSLCFAALIMTLINPLTLWDVGFQLSFAATLGLILFTPSIQTRFERFFTPRLPQEHAHWILGFLSTGLIVTLAAQILTLPLIVFYFGRLSVVGLLANLLILPAQPPIMVGGMFTLIVGLIWEVLGQIAAVVPWFFLTYTTAVVETLAAVPFASVETGALGRAAAVLYFVILLIALIVRGRPRLRRDTARAAPNRRVARRSGRARPADRDCGRSATRRAVARSLHPRRGWRGGPGDHARAADRSGSGMGRAMARRWPRHRAPRCAAGGRGSMWRSGRMPGNRGPARACSIRAGRPRARWCVSAMGSSWCVCRRPTGGCCATASSRRSCRRRSGLRRRPHCCKARWKASPSRC